MTAPFTRLLHTQRDRRIFGRVAVALAVLALGSGTLVMAWVHWLITAGYATPTYLIEVFGRYVQGEPITVLGIVTLGPLLEEVAFRGLLLTALLWFYRPWIAVLAAAALFGALHVNLMQIVPGVLMGLVLGTVYARTGSLVLSWFGHAIYNAQVGVMMAILSATAGWPNGLPTAGASGELPVIAWIIGAGGVLIGSVLLRSSLNTVPLDLRPRWRQPDAAPPADNLAANQNA